MWIDEHQSARYLLVFAQKFSFSAGSMLKKSIYLLLVLARFWCTKNTLRVCILFHFYVLKCFFLGSEYTNIGLLDACLCLLENFEVWARLMLGKSMNLLHKLAQCYEIDAWARSMLGNLMFVYSQILVTLGFSREVPIN